MPLYRELNLRPAVNPMRLGPARRSLARVIVTPTGRKFDRRTISPRGLVSLSWSRSLALQVIGCGPSLGRSTAAYGLLSG